MNEVTHDALCDQIATYYKVRHDLNIILDEVHHLVTRILREEHGTELCDLELDGNNVSIRLFIMEEPHYSQKICMALATMQKELSNITGYSTEIYPPDAPQIALPHLQYIEAVYNYMQSLALVTTIDEVERKTPEDWNLTRVLYHAITFCRNAREVLKSVREDLLNLTLTKENLQEVPVSAVKEHAVSCA